MPKIPVITATYFIETNLENNLMDSYAYQGQLTMKGQWQTEIGAYIMDTFTLRPNLTINAGLRYDYWASITRCSGAVSWSTPVPVPISCAWRALPGTVV